MSETDNLQGLDAGQLDSDKIGTAQKFNQLLRALRTAVANSANTILTTRGDLLTRNATALVRLAIGGANTVLRSNGTDPSWGQVQTADITDLHVTTAKIADLNVTTGKLADDAVTFAKMQNVATDSFIGRTTAATGDPETLTGGQALEILNDARLNTLDIFDDFHEASVSLFAISNSGTLTGVSDPNVDLGQQDHPGVGQLSTGDTATGRTAVLCNDNNFHLGGGAWVFEALIRIEDLSTITEEYDLRIGFGDTTTGDQVDGVYFEYDRNNNTDWNVVTASNSVRTRNDSNVVVAADAWVKLRIEINAAGTSATFKINGTETAGSPITTNIPTGANRRTGAGIFLVKSAGITERVVYADYMRLFHTLTNAR